MARFTVEIEDPEDLAWLEQETAQYAGSKREFFRQLVHAARTGEVSSPPPAAPAASAGHTAAGGSPTPDLPDGPPRERFLAALERVFGPQQACRLAGVDRSAVDRWSRKPAFLKKAEEARSAYVERHLVEIGLGVRKGNASALTAFLASHHPGYGLAKQSYVAQLFRPFIDNAREILEEELGSGKTGRETAKRILARFAAAGKEVERKLPPG